MLNALFLVLFGGLILFVLYDAVNDRWSRRPTIDQLERDARWWRVRRGLVIAFVAGAIITGWGMSQKAHESGFEPTLEDWAPHFGPELMVLAFAAIFVEGALRKAEQRRALRFRTVQGLMGLVSYALNHNVYFEGGASNYLEMEWDALKKRKEGRMKVLWTNELQLFDEAHRTAFDFMEIGMQFALAVDDLNSKRSQLRVDLPTFSDWAVIFALEENAKAAFRRVPIKFRRNNPLGLDDLLDQGKLDDWKQETAALKSKWPAMSDRLDIYFKNDEEIMKLRVHLLNKFFAFQDAAIAFRDRVWESDDPDE